MSSPAHWENPTIFSPTVGIYTLTTNDVTASQQISYESHRTVSTKTTTQEVDTLFPVMSNSQQLYASITVPMTPCVANVFDLKPNLQ